MPRKGAWHHYTSACGYSGSLAFLDSDAVACAGSYTSHARSCAGRCQATNAPSAGTTVIRTSQTVTGARDQTASRHRNVVQGFEQRLFDWRFGVDTAGISRL